MKRLVRYPKIATLLALALALIITSMVLATTIVVDGNRETAWNNTDVGFATDPNESGINNNVDIKEFRWTNDNTNFYFLIEVHGPPPLMPALAPINICLNTDNSAATDIPSSNTIYRDRCSYNNSPAVSGIDIIIEAYRLANGSLWVDVYDATQWTGTTMSYKGSGTLGYNPAATTPVVEISVPLNLLGFSSSFCPNEVPMVVYYDGGDTNPDDNLPDSGTVSINCNPTPLAVTLAAFEAQPQANAVLVTWETAAELDNLGFNLYRSAAAAGPWTQLNAELIPAQNPGAVFGAVYEWLDADAAPGALAYYRLEDVDIHGVSTFHGPVSAAPLSPSAVRLSNFSAGGPFIGLALALGSLALFTGLKKRR